jgi:hypothetical protein
MREYEIHHRFPVGRCSHWLVVGRNHGLRVEEFIAGYTVLPGEEAGLFLIASSFDQNTLSPHATLGEHWAKRRGAISLNPI